LAKRTERLFQLFPDHVFVVPAVNQAVDFAIGVVAEQDPPLDAFPKEDVAGFRK
jgi:hypothetical protein